MISVSQHERFIWLRDGFENSSPIFYKNRNPKYSLLTIVSTKKITISNKWLVEGESCCAK